ncbi:myeloid-derived growth factor-like [Babylonia areolata]|uniref:myeloid-derived growth factor-like n=1 Tax=Babylonia areolata TaxID=304850 RepID=UPI003FD09574
MKLLVILSLFVCSAVRSENTNAIQDEFDVKPGGQVMVYEKELDKYKCTFTYQAQGGTNEKWQFILEKLNDGQALQCTVARGGTSYLFFETFSMSLTGPKVHLENYEAVSTRDERLKDSEVKVNKKKRTVSAVDGEFQKKLERVTLQAIVGKKPTTEL